jgi:hypothetical protein
MRTWNGIRKFLCNVSRVEGRNSKHLVFGSGHYQEYHKLSTMQNKSPISLVIKADNFNIYLLVEI